MRIFILAYIIIYLTVVSFQTMANAKPIANLNQNIPVVEELLSSSFAREESTLKAAIEGKYSLKMERSIDELSGTFNSTTIKATAQLGKKQRYKIEMQHSLTCEHNSLSAFYDVKGARNIYYVVLQKGIETEIKFKPQKLSCKKNYRAVGAFSKASVDLAQSNKYTASTGVIHFWDYEIPPDESHAEENMNDLPIIGL